MNKEYKFVYTCTDFARLWSGIVKLIDKENTDAEKNALQYLHAQYKDSTCRVFSQKMINSFKDKGITHDQKDILFTSAFYK